MSLDTENYRFKYFKSLPPESDICGCKKMDCRKQGISLYFSYTHTMINNILQNDKIGN